jgi:hypothetical protein
MRDEADDLAVLAVSSACLRARLTNQRRRRSARNVGLRWTAYRTRLLSLGAYRPKFSPSQKITLSFVVEFRAQ